MTLETFATEWSALATSERAAFAEVTRRLFEEGLLWRDDDADRRQYSFAVRNLALLGDYLMVAGFRLLHHERLHILQLVHTEGAHRRKLSKDETSWLLLCRIIYAERKESLAISLTRNPAVSVAELFGRYAEFFPGKNLRKRTGLDESLRSLAGLKLIRSAGGGFLRGQDPDLLIELLPTLEVVLPAQRIQDLASELAKLAGSSAERAK